MAHKKQSLKKVYEKTGPSAVMQSGAGFGVDRVFFVRSSILLHIFPKMKMRLVLRRFCLSLHDRPRQLPPLTSARKMRQKHALGDGFENFVHEIACFAVLWF